ncbi:hypothetical protein [Streptomyces gossypii]|uniref:hypothetical protein n=1 Tax=Streptomyces gossypii TaxID=2883101 RepID=UPI0035CCCF1B
MLRFDQEHLASAEERERQRAHWQRVMDQPATALQAAALADGAVRTGHLVGEVRTFPVHRVVGVAGLTEDPA